MILRRLLTPTIAKKVSFLLAVIALSGIAALGSVYWSLRGSTHDTELIDVAGSQRMLSEQMLAFAQEVRSGHTEDRELLQGATRQFESSLATLERGGTASGVSLPPPPSEVRDEIAGVRRTLAALSGPLRVVATFPVHTELFAEAYRALETGIPRLTGASNAVVKAYELRAEGVRRATLTKLLALASLDVALLLLGLFLTRRYIARPVRLLAEGASRLRAGDFDHRVPAVTKDELATLARAFNDMSERIAALLASEGAARTEAEAAGRALAEQNERLRELDRLKDEFVALVSHELRTPLTSIRGYVDLMLEEGGGPVSEDQRKFLGVVERNADRLLHLVNDLLFVARSESGSLRLDTSEVDLATIGAECVERAQPLATERSIELRLDAAPTFVPGDPLRLAQVLDNLISNGIKFTPEGARVAVAIRQRAGSAVIEVSDTGMGIPSGEQDRLFERFFRTSTATKAAIQGTGLGLTVVKAIVEAHGGQIAFESEEGTGTTFRVELPLVQPVDLERNGRVPSLGVAPAGRSW